MVELRFNQPRSHANLLRPLSSVPTFDSWSARISRQLDTCTVCVRVDSFGRFHFFLFLVSFMVNIFYSNRLFTGKL